MSGTRGRSGEIVNATLMEIFIVLSFVFLIYSTLVEDTSERSIAELTSLKQALTKQVKDLEAQAKELSTKLRTAEKQRDDWKGKYEVIFPPYCEGYERGGDPYGEFTLEIGGRITTHVKSSYNGLVNVGKQSLSPSEFKSAFSRLRKHTRDNGCRLAVKVRTETSELSEYRPAMREIRDIFYTYGELLE